jgi:tetratricopeptide (TPR) repeat protein
MNVPDWRTFALEQRVLIESAADGSRLVVWLPGDRDGKFQYWQRIGSVARAEVTSIGGLCTTDATLVPARQQIGRSLGQFWTGLRKSKGKRSFLLPDGSHAEQCGDRQGDLLLVWAEDGEHLDLERVMAHWPQRTDARKLGPNLYLVAGVGTPRATSEKALEFPPGASPREHAEQLLAAALKSGDRRQLATATADLGIILLSEADAQGAIKALESALAISRELGDRAGQTDVIGNLGMALLAVGQPVRARALFEEEITDARAAGDRFEEKVALERLGIAYWTLHDFPRALAFFENAETMARQVGDRQQAANVLWHQAIQHAELGRRDLATAKAEEAVTLFKLLGKPQADWYGAQLQKFRMGLFDEPASGPVAGVSASMSPHAYLGGSIVSSVMAGQNQAGPTPAKQQGGPGLLRMAMSATKAMASFVGSGFKTTPPDLQQKRIQTCAACEHHTGMRCKVCGCFTQAKSRLLHEDCPIGKWPG